ncbi:diacylglycerol/lipid kinase family protein [Parvularcula oceani]|uniref:diacylglycerol/lipid kinase family protein n=1 Tax=Parvularcula oceani TaxID=1247963 RepID=UPI0004E15640|nr:diacylglycerol kinase family protein [Parvularcula oceani]
MRTCIIYNPGSGGGEHTSDAIEAAFARAGHDVRLCDSHSDDFPGMLGERFDLLVAAGGDGTVSKLLKAQPDRSVPVGILPIGTANNIASSFGLRADAGLLAGKWRTASRRVIELCWAEGPFGREIMIESAGLGPLCGGMQQVSAEPEALKDAEHPIRHARRRVCDVLRESKDRKSLLTLDGETVGEVALAEILNIPMSGPDLLLSPRARTDDGLLDIAYAEEAAPLADWIADGAAGAPPLQIRRARTASLRWDGQALRIGDEFPRFEAAADLRFGVGNERSILLCPEA